MKNVPITGIIPFTYFLEGMQSAGSSILRAEAIVKNAPDFKIWQHGLYYDQLIFQKAYWPEMMQLFEGPKILDLCDPDWLEGEVNIVEIGALVDAITCSSQPLTDLLEKYFPDKVYHIPDRLDLKTFPQIRDIHQSAARNIAWFGYIKNAYETLIQLAPAIRENQLNLTIIADRPYDVDDEIKSLNPTFIRYDPVTAYELIKKADIVLNPRSKRAKFKFKSNNKSVISWKLGVPVAENLNDLELLLDPAERNLQVNKMIGLIHNEYDIIKSIEQYREIFTDIKASGK